MFTSSAHAAWQATLAAGDIFKGVHLVPACTSTPLTCLPPLSSRRRLSRETTCRNALSLSSAPPWRFPYGVGAHARRLVPGSQLLLPQRRSFSQLRHRYEDATRLRCSDGYGLAGGIPAHHNLQLRAHCSRRAQPTRPPPACAAPSP